MKAILTFVLLAVSCMQAAAISSYSYTPSVADLNDLDHHSAYTWRIDNININPATITGATITISHISNWDPNPNILFTHLFDTAKYSGVRSFTDATGTPVPDNQMIDNFAGALLGSNPLIAAGTGNTFLTSPSFTMTPTTFTYTFTAAQLNALRAYIANGHDIAFGFDPDCHFFNNGVTFTMTVPEGGETAVLLAVAALGLVAARRFLSA